MKFARLGSFGARLSNKLKALKATKPPTKKKHQKYVEDIKSVSDIFKELKALKKKERFLVMAIGNDLKGDDGVAWRVADMLAKEIGKDENFLTLKTSVPENHVKEISDFSPNLLIIIDAADFGKRPGAIKYIREYQISEAAVSTHTTPLTIFLRLYQADQPVKRAVTLIGIQKKSSDFGQPMTAPVREAGERLAKLIAELYRKGFLSFALEDELENLYSPLRKIRGKISGGRDKKQAAK